MPYKILIVCSVNKNRSAVFSAYLKHYAKARWIRGITIDSAGSQEAETKAINREWKTSAGSEVRRRLMEESMHEINSHRSKPLSGRLVKESGLILAVSESNKKAVARKYPESRGKVFTVKEFLGLKGDIEDAHYHKGGSVMYDKVTRKGTPEAYRKMLMEIRELAEMTLDRLAASSGRDITIPQAEKLMRECLKERPAKIAHSLAVSRFAYQTAKKIMRKHPEMKINLSQVRVLGLLHDIGQSRGNHTQHAFEAEKILMEMGLARCAESVVKHGDTHEIAGRLKMGRDLRPRSIEEKLMVYADSQFDKQEFTGLGEKFRRLRLLVGKKYPEIAGETERVIKRISGIIREIEGLL